MCPVRLPLLAVASLALPAALPAASPAATGHAARCSYRAHFHAPTHHPKANRKWWIRVTVSPSSLRTRMHYEFLFHGRRVSTQYVRGHKNFSFRHRTKDDVVWPSKSIGLPLTFRIVLHNRCGTKHWDYSVRVRR